MHKLKSLQTFFPTGYLLLMIDSIVRNLYIYKNCTCTRVIYIRHSHVNYIFTSQVFHYLAIYSVVYFEHEKQIASDAGKKEPLPVRR